MHKSFEAAQLAIEAEAQRILAVRDLVVIRHSHAWGVGIVLENPGKASLSFFADFRDAYTSIEFFAPEHLSQDRTFVDAQYMDDFRYRFSLYMVLEAKRLPYRHLRGSVNPNGIPGLKRLLASAVDAILASCMDVIDGDLSIRDSFYQQS